MKQRHRKHRRPVRCACCASLLAALAEAQVDAARYRWLRDGNAYAPEECSITGGAALDDLVDGEIPRGKWWRVDPEPKPA